MKSKRCQPCSLHYKKKHSQTKIIRTTKYKINPHKMIQKIINFQQAVPRFNLKKMGNLNKLNVKYKRGTGFLN